MFSERLLLAFASILLLAGCAAKGPAFTDAPPPGSKALVYIYRQPNFALSAQTAGFDVDEKRIATLDPGGYTFLHVGPGRHELKQFWPLGLMTITAPGLWQDLKMPLDVQAGETHYFRMSSGTGSTYEGMAIQWQLTEVPGDTGRQEIALEKFQPQDKNMPAEFKP